METPRIDVRDAAMYNMQGMIASNSFWSGEDLTIVDPTRYTIFLNQAMRGRYTKEILDRRYRVEDAAITQENALPSSAISVFSAVKISV